MHVHPDIFASEGKPKAHFFNVCKIVTPTSVRICHTEEWVQFCVAAFGCIVAADVRQCCLLFCAALAVDTGAVEVICL